MGIYALVKNGKVQNVIVADSREDATGFALNGLSEIEVTEDTGPASPGDDWDGEVFISNSAPMAI